MNGERSTQDHAEASKPRNRTLAGLVRRMVVTLTRGGRWQLRGFAALKEVVTDVEVFQGIGIWARPPAPSSPRRATVEAVVLNLGDSDAPIVIAVRDERTRAAVAAAIAEDTTILYNSAVRVELTAAGLLELRGHAGAAVPPALLADLSALKTAMATITPSTGLGDVVAVVNAILAKFAAWSPAGAARVRVE